MIMDTLVSKDVRRIGSGRHTLIAIQLMMCVLLSALAVDCYAKPKLTVTNYKDQMYTMIQKRQALLKKLGRNTEYVALSGSYDVLGIGGWNVRRSQYRDPISLPAYLQYRIECNKYMAKATREQLANLRPETSSRLIRQLAGRLAVYDASTMLLKQVLSQVLQGRRHLSLDFPSYEKRWISRFDKTVVEM